MISIPAKLILSGEHAVVYGCPALGMTIDRYVTASLHENIQNEICINFQNNKTSCNLSFENAAILKNQIEARYQAYLSGKQTIQQVFSDFMQLAQYSVAVFCEKFQLKKGFVLTLSSSIPMGSGMGSSAAVIIAILKVLLDDSKKILSQKDLFEMALSIENKQHGASSGLDIKIILERGVLLFQQGQCEKRKALSFPLYLVNTGVPESSTGECVLSAASFFKGKKADFFKKAFTETTLKLDTAISQHDEHEAISWIKKNHELLCDIGVVPLKVNMFIDEIIKAGFAAKICGAGAVKGENAGIVWVLINDKKKLEQICERYHYSFFEANAG